MDIHGLWNDLMEWTVHIAQMMVIVEQTKIMNSFSERDILGLVL